MSDKVNKALRDFTRKQLPETAFMAKVVKVNSNYTVNVDPVDGSARSFGVKLKPVDDTTAEGMILVPAVGSLVMVVEITKLRGSHYVKMVEKIDKVLIKADNHTFEMDQSGFKLDGDSFGGLIKINELRSELAKVNAVIRAIQTAFTAWVPVPSDGGAALKGISQTFTSLSLPSYSNIENTQIKHGSV